MTEERDDIDQTAIDVDELYPLPRNSNQPYPFGLQGAALSEHCQPTSKGGGSVRMVRFGGI